MHYTYPSSITSRRAWINYSLVNDFTERAMMLSHLHLGHWVKSANMGCWGLISGKRGSIIYLDLVKAKILLRSFWGFYNNLLRHWNFLWVVNGDTMYAPQMRLRISPILFAFGHTVIHDKWNAGLLTNFKKKVNHWSTAVSCLGRLPQALPSSIFLFRNKDSAANWTGSECFSLSIPWSMVIDSNLDPSGVTYPLVGNNDTNTSLEFFMSLLHILFTNSFCLQIRDVMNLVRVVK